MRPDVRDSYAARCSAGVTGLPIGVYGLARVLCSGLLVLSLFATQANAQAPAAPTNVSASDVGGDQGGVIQVSWTLSADDAVGLEYRIYRATTSGSLGALVKTVANGTATTTENSPVTGTNYYYIVLAYTLAGGQSTNSNQYGPVKALDNTAPAAPTGTAAVDNPSDNGYRIVITWTESTDAPGGGGANDVTQYRIYRSTVNGATGAQIGSASAGTDTYVDYDLTLTNGGTYYYIVRAFDGNNESVSSNQASTIPVDNKAPGAPTSPVGVDHPNDSGGAIDLTWARSSDDATGADDVLYYNVYRTEVSGVYVGPPITTAAAGATGITDATAITDTSYYYTIRAFDGTQESAASAQIGPTVARDNRPIQPPNNVFVVDLPGDQGDTLTITWSASADAPGQGGRDIVTEYRVYRRLTGGNFQSIGSVTVGNPLTFVDTPVTKSTNYDYTVRASDGLSESADANVFGPVQAIDNIAPGPASGVNVVDTPSDNGSSITVTWTRSVEDDGVGYDDVTEYHVYRSPVAGGFSPPAVGTVAAGSTLFVDSTAVDGGEYFYMVRAYDATRESTNSGVDSAVASDNLAPQRPVNLLSADTPDDTGGQIDLTWSLSPDDAVDVIEYRIYRGTTSSLQPELIAVLPAGTATHTDTTVENQQIYYYKAQAWDGAYVSADSNVTGPVWAVDNRDLLPPTAVRGSDNPNDQGGRLNLTWELSGDDGAGRDTVREYHLYRKISGVSGAATRVGTVPAGTTAFSDYAATVGADYVYTIRSYNGLIESPDSNAVGPIGSADNVTPGPVTNVAAVDEDPDFPSSVVVSWEPSPDDSPTGDVTQYRVYRSVVPGGYGAPLGTSNAGQTAYTDTTSLPSVNYYYVVRAYDGSNESVSSNEAGPIGSTDVVPPEPVTAVSAADIPGDNGGAIRVEWTRSGDDGAGVDDVVRYDIRRMIDALGTPEIVGSVGAGSDSFDDITAENRTLYFYIVRATDGANSADSEVAGPASAADNLPPGAPAALAADTVPGGQGSLISLEWQLSVDDDGGANDVTEYQIYRSQTNTQFGTALATVPAGAGTYIDESALASIDYYYSVRAYDDRWRSDPSPTAGPAQALDITPPTPPSNVMATGEAHQVLLEWSPSTSSDLAGYFVYRSRQQGAAYQRLNGVPLTEPAYIDEGVTEEITYYYCITSVDQASPFNESDQTPAVAATPLDITPPAAPVGLSATASNRRVDLTWNANTDDDLTGYRVYRGLAETGPFTRVSSATITGLEFADTAVANGTTYTYYVTAIDDASVPNVSLPSETASAQPERVFRFVLDAGVHMVSFPVINVSADPRESLVANHDRWRLARWWRPDQPDAGYHFADIGFVDPLAQLVPSDATGGQAHPTVLSAPAGLGYWLVVNEPVELLVGGDGVPATGAYPVHLYPGWNQVGNPWESDVAWSQIQTDPPESIQSVGWVWDSDEGYKPLFGLSADNLVDRIDPLTSCWVKAEVECDLLIPTGTSTPVTPSARAARALFEGVDWSVRLGASAGSRHDSANWVGVANGERQLPCSIEGPPSPGGFVDLYVKNDFGQRLAVDLRQTSAEEYRWDVVIETDQPDTAVVLSIGDQRELPRDWTLLLRDLETGRETFLRTMPTYEFRSGPKGARREFALVARRGNLGALRIAGLQTSLIRQGDVSLSFTLTRDAKTTVEILNAAGRIVRRLEASRARSVGAQEVYWNRTSDTGAQVPSGFYTVSIAARAESGEMTHAVRTLRVDR